MDKKSKAFEEFVAKTCEEEVENNEEYKQQNNLILEQEVLIKRMLGKDKVEVFLRYEDLIVQQMTLGKILAFEAGMKTNIKI